jgi:hypothetical protein
VGKELLSITKADDEDDDDEDELSSGIGKRLWNTICSALIDTNQGAMIPTKSEDSSEYHEDYRNLMARYQHRDTTSVRELFQAAGTPEVSTFTYFLTPPSTSSQTNAGRARSLCSFHF